MSPGGGVRAALAAESPVFTGRHGRPRGRSKRAGKGGIYVPTLRDVAVLAGVSTATVSHVINQTRRTTQETRARVEVAIKQLGFVPNEGARALAMRKTGVGTAPAFKGGNGGKASGNGASVAEAEEAAPAQA